MSYAHPQKNKGRNILPLQNQVKQNSTKINNLAKTISTRAKARDYKNIQKTIRNS
jgi:hypothetical protein